MLALLLVELVTSAVVFLEVVSIVAGNVVSGIGSQIHFFSHVQSLGTGLVVVSVELVDVSLEVVLFDAVSSAGVASV